MSQLWFMCRDFPYMTSAERVLPHQPFPARAAIFVRADEKVQDALLI